jgi:hypothetical protein
MPVVDSLRSWFRGGAAVPRCPRARPVDGAQRRCLGIAEQHNGWLGAIAAGKAVSTYLCMTERGMQRALLTVNAAGIWPRQTGGRPGAWCPVTR